MLKLERIPLQVLVILIEQNGQLVTREEIAEKIWGKDVFLDTDNSLDGAIRKIRQALKDDPQQPRYVETLPGRGYRFIAPVSDASPRLPGLTAAPAQHALIRRLCGRISFLEQSYNKRDEPAVAVAAPRRRQFGLWIALVFLLCHRTCRVDRMASLLWRRRGQPNTLNRRTPAAKPLR